MSPSSKSRSADRNGASFRRLARRLGVDFRVGEGAGAGLLFLAFFFFVTFLYSAKSVRQATFIDAVGAANLPYVYLLVALCSYPFLRLYARLADRIAQFRLIVATCAVIGLSMVAFWWLFQHPWTWVPVVFYVWLSIVFLMTVSQFWSFANNLLDPRQAKRLFGFIGAGGLLGGIAGGQVARWATQTVDTRYALLVSALLIGLGAATLHLVQRLVPGGGERVAGAAGLQRLEKARDGLEAIRGSRQLQIIATLMVLTVIVAQIVDLQFNWAVEESITGLDRRTAFYGNFYSIVGVSAFLFQLLFTSRIHRKLGVGVAMRVLPVTMALGSGSLIAAAAFFPWVLLPSAFALKVGENGIRYSLDQATRELLFLPVPPKARLKAKAFIDVFVQRSAKGLAALLLLPVSFGLLRPVDAAWASLVLVAVWLGVTVAAQRQYVRSFRSGLKERTVDTEVPINLADVATLEILVQSLGSSDRRQVLQSLEILAANGRASLVPPLLLYHDDPGVRRKTLEVLRQARRRDAAPLIERRLGDTDPYVRAEAVQTLADLAGRDACDLMLPRLREADAGVRAAAVACLANFGGAERVDDAEQVLDDLLADADPASRREAAKALGAIDDPRFSEELVELLHDREPLVLREAIAAIRRRVDRQGYNPIYAATLVSLLRRRQVKHEAREALIALGEPVVPTLTYFLTDPDEPLWVRRAIPMTLARIGTPSAAEALLESVEPAGDAFLRRKILKALGAMPEDRRGEIGTEVVDRQVRAEVRAYLQTLADLCSLGMDERGRLEGPLVRWNDEAGEPGLLDRLLAERLEDHVANIFRLLALNLPGNDMLAAHRSLVSGRPALRNAALEYLDNTLGGEGGRDLLAAIGDNTLGDKLAEAGKRFRVELGSGRATLERLLEGRGLAEADRRDLRLAVLYKIHSDRISALYPAVARVRTTTDDPLVEETAEWVHRRLPPI